MVYVRIKFTIFAETETFSLLLIKNNKNYWQIEINSQLQKID